MRQIILILHFLFFTEISFSQINVDFGHRIFNFKNNKSTNPVYLTLDSIPENIAKSVIKEVEKHTGCLNQYISFVKVQKIEYGSEHYCPNFKKYYEKRKCDESNYLYHLPAFEFIFNLNHPQIGGSYYFNICTNSNGKIIGEIPNFNSLIKSCTFFSKKNALKLAEKKLKVPLSEITLEFVYFYNKDSFVWLATCFTKDKTHHYLCKTKYVIFYASNGKLIKKGFQKTLYE